MTDSHAPSSALPLPQGTSTFAPIRTGWHVPRSPRLYQVAFDMLTLAVSFWGYYLIRFKTGWFSATHEMFDTAIWGDEMMIVAAAFALALYGYWMLLFWFSGLYANWYIRSPFDEFFTVIRVTFIGCCILGLVIVLDDVNIVQQNSRFIVFLYWLNLSACVCVGRLLARLLQEALRERGFISFSVILVGSAAKLSVLLDSLLRAPAFGYKPIGAVLNTGDELDLWRASQNNSARVPALGTFEELPTVLDMLRPQELLMSVDAPNHEEMLHIATHCDERGIAMKIVPDLYEIFSGQARTTQIYGMPLIEVRQQLMKPWEEIVKRLMDIVFSALALTVGMPFWVLVGLVVRLESPGPALYSQERVGKNGRRFMIYKFRSMRTDAEKDGPQWAKTGDARVTRVGRIIRKTHIDEIPQFWNILKGDMSLVGPRPERPFFAEKYTKELPYYPRRHRVRPGLTGWYQIQFETQEETVYYVRKRLEYDFFYIEHMSFRLDIEILVRTVFRVLRGSGTA